jgi:hypothetical protein
MVGVKLGLLTSMEEHKLSVFKNNVTKGTTGLKRDELVEGWSKLHNEEPHNLYSLPNILRMIKSRRMRWAEHAVQLGRTAYRVLAGKQEGKRPLA